MVFNILQLGLLFQIEGQVLLTDLSGEISLFDVDEKEEELCVIDTYVSDCHLWRGEDLMFQWGNKIVAGSS